MESNLQSKETPARDDTPTDASRLLNDLAGDRASLAERMAAPGWLYPAAGLLAAIYIATPLIEADAVRRIAAGATIGSIAFLVWAFQIATGVKVSRAGAAAQLTLGVLVMAILVLLSTSFALASLGLNWWILLPSAAGFVLTIFLGKRFHSQYRDRVRHGR